MKKCILTHARSCFANDKKNVLTQNVSVPILCHDGDGFSLLCVVLDKALISDLPQVGGENRPRRQEFSRSDQRLIREEAILEERPDRIPIVLRGQREADALICPPWILVLVQANFRHDADSRRQSAKRSQIGKRIMFWS